MTELTVATGRSVGVFIKDDEGVLGEGMRKRLVATLEELEKQCTAKIWHPGSNTTVLNLIHPSLYPFKVEVDVNRVLQNPHHGVPRDYLSLYPFGLPVDYTKGEKYMKKRKEEEGNGGSKNEVWDDEYQWLPSDVKVEEDGAAHFISYVGGLDGMREVDRELYKFMEAILTGMIPLFEKVLLHRDGGPSNPVKVSEGNEGTAALSLRNKIIQVIPAVKSTLLTPWNMQYPGGEYHHEGARNEGIVAVGIYYSSTQNISESILSLRHCQENGSVKDIGDIKVKDGRSVVFPNVYQHKVEKFGLKDEKLLGARRMMGFFLVNPTKHILSTADIMPLRGSYFFNEIVANEVRNTLETMRTHRINLAISAANPDWVATTSRPPTLKGRVNVARRGRGYGFPMRGNRKKGRPVSMGVQLCGE